MKTRAVVSVSLVLVLGWVAYGGDWPGFRGPGSTCVSDETNLPTTWSEAENLRWKTPLPGPGSSSPIVCGGRVFVTSYSGYGVDGREPGDPEDLKRHLLCINADNGKILWEKTVPSEVTEDPYRGSISEHGYATSTPVTDGQRVYVFFGKTGVLGFDFEGKQRWQTSVGTESSNRRWGSASSPIVHENLVIVNASEESLALIALDKNTGAEVWKVEADKMELSYSTPVVVTTQAGRKELVIAVPFEVWAFTPGSGELLWYAHMNLGGNIAPTPAVAGDLLVVFGGFPSTEAVAIRIGGEGNVTDSHIAWTSQEASYVPSPLVHNGRLHWVDDRGYAYCAMPETGQIVYKEKLPARGGSKPFYASMVCADGKLYAVSRTSGTFVLAARPEFEQLAVNVIESDDSDFNATPAISDGRIFLRSNRQLYCIAKK
jgi:outer membrane protein assembly factor BamB